MDCFSCWITSLEEVQADIERRRETSEDDRDDTMSDDMGVGGAYKLAGQGKAVTQRHLQYTGNAAPHQIMSVDRDVCANLNEYYCALKKVCVPSCETGCNWQSVENNEQSSCDTPSPETCAKVNKYFCGSDDACHTSCNSCTGRGILDASQSACLAPWWNPNPSNDMSTWVCRHRYKVGRVCNHDQDCIYGLRKCAELKTTTNRYFAAKECLPYKPYEETHMCEVHHDCPHINYYCPKDPTGVDSFWIQYCRKAKGENRKCTHDDECQTDMLCNLMDSPSPRCRRYFSLPLGHRAHSPLLCTTLWTNNNNVCTYAAKSKRVGRRCASDSDCTTTDPTGKTGTCSCKDWWSSGTSKYCLPVAGDYDNKVEKMRDWLYFKAKNCGRFWTDQDCLEEFGDEAKKLHHALECETQTLSRGPYLPPADDCQLNPNNDFVDYCSLLPNGHVRKGLDGAEGL